MKNSLLLILVLTGLGLKAQLKPRTKAYSLSYYGEFVSHPGLKVGYHYDIHNWSSTINDLLDRSLSLAPVISFSHHRNYQDNFNFDLEISYLRKSKKNIWEWGLLSGYQRSYVPNSWRISSSGIAEPYSTFYSALRNGLFFCFHRQLYNKGDQSVFLFIKPSIMAAWTGYPTYTGYFFLELGLKYYIS